MSWLTFGIPLRHRICRYLTDQLNILKYVITRKFSTVTRYFVEQMSAPCSDYLQAVWYKCNVMVLIIKVNFTFIKLK